MEIYLKKVKETDIELIFQWANDEETRKNSFHMASISFEEHKQWFEQKIHSNTCEIYIAYRAEKPVGQVRLEYEEDKAYISYSVEKNERGKGYGKKIISSAEQILLEGGTADVIVAKVKFNNISSQKVFEKLGYEMKKMKEYTVYFKVLKNNADVKK